MAQVMKAKRRKAYLRLAFTGPTNSGKTYSSLRVAYGVVKAAFPEASEQDIWDKICVIDTERSRALFYAERNDLPLKVGEFNYIEIEPPYTVEKYLDAVAAAQKAVGPNGCIIVDSLSHAWAYKGGVLDKHQQLVAKGKNSFTSWNEAGSLQNDLIDTILSVKSHLIVTMRSKMEYVLETNTEGKVQPQKKGLKPIQRDDTEYEFDITLMLDEFNIPTIIKDTTFLKQINLDEPITEQLGEQLIKWLNNGVDSSIFIEEKRMGLVNKILDYCKTPSIKSLVKNLVPGIQPNNLSIEEATKVLAQIEEAIK